MHGMLQKKQDRQLREPRECLSWVSSSMCAPFRIRKDCSHAPSQIPRILSKRCNRKMFSVEEFRLSHREARISGGIQEAHDRCVCGKADRVLRDHLRSPGQITQEYINHTSLIETAQLYTCVLAHVCTETHEFTHICIYIGI